MHWLFADVGQSLPLHPGEVEIHRERDEVLLLHEVGIAGGRVLLVLEEGEGVSCCSLARRSWRVVVVTHIFEPVQVLVPLAAEVAFVWLLLLHAQGARIRSARLRVDNGESAIPVLVQLLGGMAVSLVVPARAPCWLVGVTPGVEHIAGFPLLT